VRKGNTRLVASVVAAVAVPVVLLAAFVARPRAQAPAGVPVVGVETSKGTFWFETFPREAPTSVAHILDLVRARFYDGQRVHRAVPGLVVQFGDPRSTDPATRDRWGRGPDAGSGTPVGAAEINDRRRHRRGTVGLAHMGNPARADSQLYVALEDRSDLDGRYAIIGQVIAGVEVLDRLEVGDVITRVYLDQ
jgi:cyclophilin family peptidyl-prolyl cis-trans isomerase